MQEGALKLSVREEFISTITKAGAYGGGAVSIYGGLSTTEWMAIAGAVIALLSAAYNVWHTTQMRKIARSKK